MVTNGVGVVWVVSVEENCPSVEVRESDVVSNKNLVTIGSIDDGFRLVVAVVDEGGPDDEDRDDTFSVEAVLLNFVVDFVVLGPKCLMLGVENGVGRSCCS